MGQFAQQQQMYFDPTTGQMIPADVAGQWADNSVRDRCGVSVADGLRSASLRRIPAFRVTASLGSNNLTMNHSNLI